MIFESLWPLLFLAAVPVIIILYLLKPKGQDYLNSSNLLWKKLLKNEQSKTFFEKFVHNILMYLQILIVGLLVIALMSPFINRPGQNGGRKILLVDTSGSMQHVGEKGESRMEEAIGLACDYVKASENTRFSLVTVDELGAKLLAVDITDKESLLQTLRNVEASDSGGSLLAAQGILDTLAGGEEDVAADLIVYTDGAGAADFEGLNGGAERTLHVVGEPAMNVANEYVVFTEREDGLYDVMVSMTNYSDQSVSLDVGLYEEQGSLIALSPLDLAASETEVSLFEGVDWKGQNLSARISGIRFADGRGDSLEADNVSQTVKNRGNLINGLLVGEGNIFLEKAYQAVTGLDVAKAESDAAARAETGSSYNVVIYEDGEKLVAEEGKTGTDSRLIFGNAYKTATETLENVVLNVIDCDLAAGLKGFTIGVNKAYCFDLPDGAESFLEYEGKCVGYYVERDGVKEVVVGFDVRETDFPLRAEFPVFLANAMIYLSDTSWLASNVYYAGEEIVLQPWAEPDMADFDRFPAKSGVYRIGNEDYQESYVVRFRCATESDGRKDAESIVGASNLKLQQVRKTVRNLFLVIALLFLIVEWIVYVRQMRYRGKFYLAIRCGVLLLVILALFGIQIRMGSNETATIFVADLSDSNEEHLEEMKRYLDKTVEKMPAGNVYGIVTFGQNTLVEQVLTPESQYRGLMTVPESTATNFEEAVSKALTMIPNGSKGRIVMLTDGKETTGDIDRMAGALTTAGTEFLALLYENTEEQDAYIENVNVPSYLHPGDKYSVTVQVESNYDTDAVIELYNGSKRAGANTVHLNKGSNRFVFSQQVAAEITGNALENLQVRVLAEGDVCEENDIYSAYAVVEAPPKVLVINGTDTNSAHFNAVLTAAGCDYNMVSALNAPDHINDMLAYKSIVLVDTYIDELPQGFLDNLETYVKDYGCGFICCGGEDSFALGGYRDTVLETVLPVDMEPRNINEMPSMAMVMVIDRSGSMCSGVNGSKTTNLDIAIRAATVAVDNLRNSDYVGVLTFDDGYQWQVELMQNEDRTEIKGAVEGIAAGGGTTIKPALEEACRVLAGSDAAVKHVVLLTDGMGETTNFQDVVNNYTGSGITLSTVAVGRDSDTKLLESLAKDCGGRYYYSDISTDIPKIFAQEVFLGGDSFIQNGEFPLNVWGGHELTSNLFREGWPQVLGYIAASPKTASSSLITAGEKEDPILTVWQYGLGKTVAWNSDVTGEWTKAFAGQADYAQLWKRIVDYSTGNADLGEDQVNVVTAGESTHVVYETADYDGETKIQATVIDPEGNPQDVTLHATAPGKYEAELSTPKTGLYHFNIRRMVGEEIQSYLTTAAAVQFSYEYKFDVSSEPYLQFVNQYGRLITEDDDVWTHIKGKAGEKRPLTNWLLGLAICLFLADVAMRRFQYVPKRKLRWSPSGRKNAENVIQAQIGGGDNKSEAVAGDRIGETIVSSDGAGMADSPEKAQKAVRNKKPKEQKKKKESEQTLDTSQLLKKKDDRNL